ncbi:MAG: lipid-A-disaccharide synthase N-terminal domain-containing protein [Candidatus Omnitrophica bacterium]|nr:lipid-A-disaccharide synthase N-terminal domain-containing protein [Candidatus Omnitrophota bacterium]MCM8793212.1 lipid-A-disaccharide synthase N-terminal domain-containing protein [Candidatus Omnitrophota bacterium]
MKLNFWLILGFTAQFFFFLRFFVQWIVSEKKGKSTIPLAFWYLSLLGGTLLLIYALYRQDPVFILGQAMGMVIYVRNLILIKKEITNPKS